MGLSGGRKRVKISHDPNNTHWSRSTENYGHRMLLSQGWSPGTTLGAPNASYKQHLTQASQSHIRVAMRADNLGLGAKTGSGQEAGECVGLDAFQAMLGRLNGKSEEVLGKEQEVRDEMKLRAHVERKGMVRFVYGGRLVGDEYEDGEEGKSKAVPVAPAAEKERKNDKKEKKSRIGGVEQSESTAEASRNEEEASTEKKKIKKRKKVADGDEEPIAMSKLAPETTSEEASNSEDEATQKARRKAERAERRERKRQRREAKAAKLAEAGRDDENMPMRTVPAAPVEAEKKVLTVQLSPSTTAVSATVGGRHMSVRSRYIAAKRRAVMDPQALKEILMVKA